MAGQDDKKPGLPWWLRSPKAKASRIRKLGRRNARGPLLGPGADKSWSLDKEIEHSEHGQAMRWAQSRLKIQKKKKGVGSDHFTKLTKKKKVRKGPISR